MNPDQQLDQLFTLARAATPETARAEFGFEARLLARLREERQNSWAVLGWRLAPFCAAMALAAGAWCYSYVGVQAEPEDALEAVRGGDASALIAWLPEADS